MTNREIIDAIIAYCATLPKDAEVATSTMVRRAIPEEEYHDQAFAVVKGATCIQLARYCKRGPSHVNSFQKIVRPWLWHGETEPHEEVEQAHKGGLRSMQIDRIEAKLDQVLALLAR